MMTGKQERDSQRMAYLQALGVTVWKLRRHEKNCPTASESQSPPSVPLLQTVDSDAWEVLQNEALRCQQCGLAKHRQQVVFGCGDRQAKWLLVGEAPGAQEDQQGQPFVGRAGKLLNAMLFAMGLSRQEVYIANVLKCRPPGNRDPLGEECRQCLPYLRRQLQLLQPSIILAMGRFAAQALLQTNEPISQLRGRQHVFEQTGTPLLVTYHPAYLLRSPLQKRKVWVDLQIALKVAATLI